MTHEATVVSNRRKQTTVVVVSIKVGRHQLLVVLARDKHNTLSD